TTGDGGYVDNLFTGEKQGESDSTLLRGKLLIKPSDRFELQVNGMYADSSNEVNFSAMPYKGNAGVRASAKPVNLPFDVLIPTKPFTTSTQFRPFAELDVYEADAQAILELDSFTVKGLVSIIDLSIATHSDVDVSPLSLVTNDYTQDSRSYTQEL